MGFGSVARQHTTSVRASTCSAPHWSPSRGPKAANSPAALELGAVFSDQGTGRGRPAPPGGGSFTRVPADAGPPVKRLTLALRHPGYGHGLAILVRVA